MRHQPVACHDVVDKLLQGGEQLELFRGAEHASDRQPVQDVRAPLHLRLGLQHLVKELLTNSKL